MKKYIVSDLHGSGDVYNSILAYLENVKLATDEDVELFINGDLIDRGIDSCRMLLDVKERCEGKGNIKIKYLAGNHELMFYQAGLRRHKDGRFPHFDDWFLSGGHITLEGIMELSREEIDDILNFIGNLEVYHKFSEQVDGKNVLLVHAQAPKTIEDECPIKIKDNNRFVFKALWTRRDDGFFGSKLGTEGYLTIIGHTPIKKGNGIYYMPNESVINIDGACAGYVSGQFDCDHVPVVEVKDGLLEIIVFNHNNEIIKGFTYDGTFREMSEQELDSKRVFIDHTYDDCAEKCKELIRKRFN